MAKLRAGILGATGAVGQNFIRLLDGHPEFEVSYVAASPNSAGKSYAEAVKGRWLEGEIPKNIENLIVGDVSSPCSASDQCDFVFSAYEPDKTVEDKTANIQNTECLYASSGFPVISNNSAHRWTPDVPMIIPEINWDHLRLIELQRTKRKYDKGFIVTKPNCSIQSFMIPIYALIEAGLRNIIQDLDIVTEQAISGNPSELAMGILGNRRPYIAGEEDKTRFEPRKILGRRGKFGIIEDNLPIYAQCNRDSVKYGHTASVKMRTTRKLILNEIIDIWRNFRCSQTEGLYMSPEKGRIIIYNPEKGRPQPELDKDSERGMAITVGMLDYMDKAYPEVGIQFTGLSHNTVRGAAGGAILTAELAHRKGYL